ncbi:MAG: L,D-transpeptidase [Clostridia bacterium]|nr:L,D-transpeptidase [Clostridia bacterium]
MAARIRIEKAARRLTLYLDGAPARVFPVSLGRAPVGPKRAEGDMKTPEGRYFVCTRNDRSKYRLALGLSYPSAADARLAFAEGRIDAATRDAVIRAEAEGRRPPWDTPLGGFIMIHGGGATEDWTAGCVALDDEAIDALYPLVPLGAPVDILP